MANRRGYVPREAGNNDNDDDDGNREIIERFRRLEALYNLKKHIQLLLLIAFI